MKVGKILFGILLLLASTALADYHETKQLNLDADNIDELVIECGAGFLQIKGVDNLKEIRVEAEIYIDGIRESKALDFMDDHMRLSLDNRRGYAKLESSFEITGISLPFFSEAHSARIDLTVEVPKNMALDIDDGSGDITIENIDNEVAIEDGSGDIELININGRLDITDGSGELEINDIKGEIRLEDGSGEIKIENVEGDIDLNDGSGNIRMATIIGSVEIEDGSGDIEANQIQGNLFIDDGSGEIDVTDITGDVEVNDGSGDMEITQIGGSVIVDDGSGNIRIDSVKGDVEILDDDSGRCKITEVEGRVRR